MVYFFWYLHVLIFSSDMKLHKVINSLQKRCHIKSESVSRHVVPATYRNANRSPFLHSYSVFKRNLRPEKVDQTIQQKMNK